MRSEVCTPSATTPANLGYPVELAEATAVLPLVVSEAEIDEGVSFCSPVRSLEWQRTTRPCLESHRGLGLQHVARPAGGDRGRAESAEQPLPGKADVTESLTTETYDRFEPIAAEWEALAERTDASPFMRPGWIAAWLRWFGRGRMTVVCARRGGEVAGVIPVTRRRGVISSPTNWHTPSFAPVGEDQEATSVLIRALLAVRPHRLDLAFIEPTTPAFAECLRTAKSLRYRTACRVIERSPYVEIETDWESFESAFRARRRSKIRRFRRRLEDQGAVSIELERGDENLEALLTEGFAIEASGWKGKSGTAIVSTRETEGFYREVARWAAERGWLRLWFLRLDGRAIAFAYCLEHGGSHYECKVGFDPQYARFGPGVILTRARLKHSFSAGLRSYEFLGQPEPHKLDWTSTCRELARLQAFAPSITGRVSRVVWTRGRSIAVKARESGRRVTIPGLIGKGS